jgi:hypothetical protein
VVSCVSPLFVRASANFSRLYRCQVADSDATVKCPKCDWAWYCTDKCRRADLSFSGRDRMSRCLGRDPVAEMRAGHALQCTRDAL